MPTTGEYLLSISSLSSPDTALNHFTNVSTGETQTVFVPIAGGLSADSGSSEEVVVVSEGSAIAVGATPTSVSIADGGSGIQVFGGDQVLEI